MIDTFYKLVKGILALPIHWFIWVIVMIWMNSLIPLIFIGHLEAQIVLLVFCIQAIFMTCLTHWQGFTRLLGLSHLLWYPLLYYLISVIDIHPIDTWYGIWIRGLIIINGLSVIIDTIDVIRYIAGDRNEMYRS